LSSIRELFRNAGRQALQSSALPKRRSTNDLFEIFPDLPSMRPRSTEEQLAYVHNEVRRQVEATRLRAGQNILRQKAATERVRIAISRRPRKR